MDCIPDGAFLKPNVVPKKYILVFAVLLAIIGLYFAESISFYEGQDDDQTLVKIRHIRTFGSQLVKPEDYDLKFKLLFETLPAMQEDATIDFNLIGYQVRFFRTAHNIVQQSINTGIWSENDVKMRDKIKLMDEILFSWIAPRYNSTFNLKNSFNGTGIVMCVCDRYTHIAMASIQMVRQVHHSDMPIEIFYMGDDDLSLMNRRALEAVPFVTTRNINDVFDVKKIQIFGWAVKAFALLASSFQNALLMDADVVLLQPPEVLFEIDVFVRDRALFFQDRTLISSTTADLLGTKQFVKDLTPKPLSEHIESLRIMKGHSSHQQESGVVVMDKKSSFSGLMTTALLNVGEIRKEAYKHMYGDKETFWIGFSAAEEGFGWSRYIPGSGGVAEQGKDNKYKVCSLQILHVDEEKNPLWMNGGLAKNKYLNDETIVEFKDFILEPPGGRWEFGVANHACIKSLDKPGKFSVVIQDVLEKGSNIYATYSKPFEVNDVEVEEVEVKVVAEALPVVEESPVRSEVEEIPILDAPVNITESDWIYSKPNPVEYKKIEELMHFDDYLRKEAEAMNKEYIGNVI